MLPIVSRIEIFLANYRGDNPVLRKLLADTLDELKAGAKLADEAGLHLCMLEADSLRQIAEKLDAETVTCAPCAPRLVEIADRVERSMRDEFRLRDALRRPVQGEGIHTCKTCGPECTC